MLAEEGDELSNRDHLVDLPPRPQNPHPISTADRQDILRAAASKVAEGDRVPSAILARVLDPFPNHRQTRKPPSVPAVIHKLGVDRPPQERIIGGIEARKLSTLLASSTCLQSW